MHMARSRIQLLISDFVLDLSRLLVVADGDVVVVIIY
jgi:hypothetical protein